MGRQWRISVRMLPWGLRWRGPRTQKDAPADGEVRRPRWYDGLDIPDLFGAFDEGLGGFVGVLLFILAAVIAILFVLPVFIFLIEVSIVLVVMLAAVVVRVFFRQPWIIDAVADDGTRKAWKIVGYQNARRAVSDISRLMSQGVSEPAIHNAEIVR